MNTSDTQVLLDAEERINSGKTRRALEMLRPLIEKERPAALFLFAHFSVAGTETEAEFDARRLGILKRLTLMINVSMWRQAVLGTECTWCIR